MPDSISSSKNSAIPPASPWRTAIEKGLSAAKRNLIPGGLLWMFGTALIAGFYCVPPVHQVLERVGELKLQWGWIFSMISTALFGGAIPVLITRLLKQGPADADQELLISSTLLWAYKGVETDYFYRFQAWMFGEEPTVSTVISKMAVDMLIWVPLFGLLNVVLFYIWRDSGYSFRRLGETLGTHWYRRRVLPVLIANMAVWTPALLMIYCLPLALQIPVQNLILCFWVLILVFFTRD